MWSVGVWGGGMWVCSIICYLYTDDGATPLLATPPASILPVREEGSSLSHERLVQLGHLTPFGTAVEELSAGIEGPASLEMRAEEAVAKTSQPGPASILPGPASPFSSSDIMSQQMGIPHDEEGKEEEEEEGESLWSEEDEYMPTPHEIASSYSEHFSEGEELAPPSDKKGKKRLREVHSDDSEDDLVQTNWPKRKISRSSGSKKKTLDDGDEEMYQLRIRKYEELKAEPAEPDAVFNGGFHIPGSIWHKLYKYGRGRGGEGFTGVGGGGVHRGEGRICTGVGGERGGLCLS